MSSEARGRNRAREGGPSVKTHDSPEQKGLRTGIIAFVIVTVRVSRRVRGTRQHVVRGAESSVSDGREGERDREN